MTLRSVVLQDPPCHCSGIGNGVYERAGGVVCESGLKKIVAWLPGLGTQITAIHLELTTAAEGQR
jgi:hypothetical protein